MITLAEIGVYAPLDQQATVRGLMAEYAALPHTAGRWLTKQEDLAMLPYPFVRPSGVLLLALDNGVPVGCGGLLALETGVGEIKRMYVRPAARGRGVGAALLTALLAQAKVFGFARVRLDTAPELMEARGLYRRFGFTEIPHYRTGLLPDALCFERPVVHEANDAADPNFRDV